MAKPVTIAPVNYALIRHTMKVERSLMIVATLAEKIGHQSDFVSFGYAQRVAVRSTMKNWSASVIFWKCLTTIFGQVSVGWQYRKRTQTLLTGRCRRCVVMLRNYKTILM